MYSGIVLVFLVVYEVVSLSSAEICPKDFQCGNIGNLSFPFTDYAQPGCGLWMANCSDQASPMVSLGQKTQQGYLLLKSPVHGNSIRVLDAQLQDSLNQQMCRSFKDPAILYLANNSDAISFTVEPNITMIKCLNDSISMSGILEPLNSLNRYDTCYDFTIYYRNPKDDDKPLYNNGTLQQYCESITFPMAPLDSITNKSGLFELLTAEFEVTWHLSDNCVDCLNGKGSQCDIGDNSQCAIAGNLNMYEGGEMNWRRILILIAILLVSAVPTSFLCYNWIRRRILKAREKRRRDDYLHQLRGSDSFNYGDELEKGIKEAPEVKIFSLKDILTATDNFSNTNKLGQGGYGPVYKGKHLMAEK